MQNTHYSFSDIRLMVQFISKQPDYHNSAIREYVFVRAQELDMSIAETVVDIYHSAIDLHIDRVNTIEKNR